MSTTEAKVVLSVVDRITAPIAAIQARIERLTAPVRRIGRALGDVGRAAGLPQLASAVRNVGSHLYTAAGHAGALLTRMAALSGVSFAGIGFGLKKLWDTSADFESLSMSISALFGEKRRKEILDWSVSFAKVNPGGVRQTVEALQMLKGFGIDGTLGTMQALSDYTARMGKGAFELKRMALAIGQANAKAKLQAQEMLQLTEAGVPAWDLLSKATGKTIPVLMKMSEKGQLTTKYIQLLVGQMGKIAKGAGANALTTGKGILDMLGDVYETFLRKIGDAGAYAWAKLKLIQFSDFIQSQDMDGIAKRISDTIVLVGTTIEDALRGVDWAKAWEGLKAGVEVAKSIGRAFLWFANLVGGPVQGALAIIGAITFGPLIMSLASLVASLGPLAAGLLTPAGLAILIIGGAVIGLMARNTEAFGAAWGLLPPKLQAVLGPLGKVADFIDWLTDKLAAGIDKIANLIDGLTDKLASGLGWLTNGITAPFSWAGGGVPDKPTTPAEAEKQRAEMQSRPWGPKSVVPSYSPSANLYVPQIPKFPYPAPAASGGSGGAPSAARPSAVPILSAQPDVNVSAPTSIDAEFNWQYADAVMAQVRAALQQYQAQSEARVRNAIAGALTD